MADIFLDLDGTLLDISEKYWRIYNDLMASLGQPALGREQYWQCKRRRVPEADIARKTCSESMIDVYMEKRRQRIEDMEYLLKDRVWPGIPELLARWSGEHVLYMVTMRKRRRTLMQQLDRFQLGGCFREVLSEDDNVGVWNVKALLIEPHLGDRSRTLIIGDTEAEIEVGRALGIGTISVTCGIRTRELLLAARPDYLFEGVDRIAIDSLPQTRVT